LEYDRESLARAAADAGIEAEYIDIWGRTHATSDETARAILGSAPNSAAPADSPVVIREDADHIPVRDGLGDDVRVEIAWENGRIESFAASAAGERIVPPFALRPGYHEISIAGMRSPLIVCPKRTYAFDGRAAGVAISLYGVRSSRNWGCGDFTDLDVAIDAFADAGAAFVALNPLHAIANRQPYNTSPYLPQSSFYRNLIYLDVARVAKFEIGSALARDLAELRSSEFVEYERVAEIKLEAMRALYQDFLNAGGSSEFDRYIESEGAPLHDFAIYCALDREMHRRDPNVWLWTDWPEEYRDPRSPAVARFEEEYPHDVALYKFIQWHIGRQLAEAQARAIEKGMRIGLYHDLALATDRFGSDLWANREFYVSGCRVGSPPDDFSPQGQDWGFPPPNRDAHRASGYRLFAQSIRENASHGGALRIDHVMRFFRLFWIPDGMPASMGAYVRDYADDLLGILALGSQRGKFIVIGEDLGTVTGEVRHALAESGIFSYRVFWFEKNSDGSFRRPDEYPAHAAVSSTTHDLPTLAGFAAARDIEARRTAGLIDDGVYQEQLASRAVEVDRMNRALEHSGFAGDPLGFLLSTPSALAIVNQEDLTGETEQQNLPGSTWQYPNWRRKMKVAVEDFDELAGRLREALVRSGRY
jgi:4-alpha-glucanotransferase